VIDIPIVSTAPPTLELSIATAIAADSLILDLDAADARAAGGFPGAGCSVTSWHDRSASRLDGTLTQFSGCQTNGWQGDGTSARPYALVFDGARNFVQLPTIPGSIDLDQGLTIEVWARPASSGSWARFIDFGNGAANDNLVFTRAGTSGVIHFNIFDGFTTWGMPGANSRDGVLVNARWMHLVATQVSAGAGSCQRCSATGRLYANAELVNGPSYNTITSMRIDRRLNYIGRSNWPQDALFAGSMAVVRIYNRTLSQAEISKNCLALRGRFEGVACYDAQGVAPR
jgi:hypothetical protein